MFLSIRTKIVLITIAIMLFAIGINTVVGTNFFKDEYLKLLETNSLVIARNLGFRLDKLISLGIYPKELLGFEEQCREIIVRYEDISYAMVAAIDGEVLFHSDPHRRGGSIKDPDMLDALRSQREVFFISYEGGLKSYAVSVPFFNPNHEHGGAIIISFPERVLSEKTKEIVSYSMLTAGLSFIVAIILLIMALTRWVTRPLSKLVGTIRDIMKSRVLSKRVDIRSEDEIGQLASVFDEMTENLQKTTTSIDNLNREIEARKKAEEELSLATTKLVHTERMSAVGELTAGVAHELNQPLNVIKIICQSLLKNKADHGVTAEALNTDLPEIITQVDRMAGIIDHMRFFSQREEGAEEEIFDVNKVIANSFVFLEQQISDNNISLVKEFGRNLPPLKGDCVEIERAFLNILSNAMSALKACKKESKSIIVRTYILETENSVVVEVEDNAYGIAKEDIGKIFQPFFTTRESLAATGRPAKGKGLGLAIASKIAERHRGRIEVESEIGTGSAFKIILPFGASAQP